MTNQPKKSVEDVANELYWKLRKSNPENGIEGYLETITQTITTDRDAVRAEEMERIACLCYQADTVEDVYYLIFNDFKEEGRREGKDRSKQKV